MKAFYLKDVTRREKQKQKPLIIVSTVDKENGEAKLAQISFYDILQYTPETASSGLPLNKSSYTEYFLDEEVFFTLVGSSIRETITIRFSLEKEKIVIQEEYSKNLNGDNLLFDILQNFGMVKENKLTFFTIPPQKGKAPAKEKNHRTLAARIKQEPTR